MVLFNYKLYNSGLANTILCNYENIQSLTDEEKRALTRDNLARDNPDALLSGIYLLFLL